MGEERSRVKMRQASSDVSSRRRWRERIELTGREIL